MQEASEAGRTRSKMATRKLAATHLGPEGWRVACFFLFAFGSVLAPLALLFGLWLAGPDPYLLDRAALNPEWVGKRLGFRTYELEVHAVEGSSAGSWADRLADSTPARSRSETLGVHRYVHTDSGRAGLILALEGLVLRIEADGREGLEDAVAAIPFVERNPQPGLLDRVLSESPWALLVGLLLYAAFLVFPWAWVASWAAAVRAEASVQAVPAARLRRKLAEINDLEVPVGVGEEAGDLIFEFRLTDARWARVLERGGLQIAHRIRVRLDEANHVARGVETQRRVRWSTGPQGFRAGWAWKRSIDFGQLEIGRQLGLDWSDGDWRLQSDYDYRFSMREVKQPLLTALIASGWSYRPVLGLSRLWG